jgi:predicted mannosyl-3-phosphoglycerate phosphatase (HAD superfamily)
MLIYLDFDGTVVEHAYPEIGADNPNALKVIRRLQDAGHSIILNTYRADLNDGSLQEALNYLHHPGRNLLLISEHTPLKINPPNWNWDQAVKDNTLFIDDVSSGTPMIQNVQLPFGQQVDWKTLESWFEENGVI